MTQKQFEFNDGPVDDPVKFGTSAHKLVRRDDPDTSKEAAALVNTSRLERMVYDAIASYGAAGVISDELRAKFFDGYSYSSITARYKALLDRDMIEIIGHRRGRSNRNQRIMRAVS